MLNHICIAGRLVRDPELRQTTAGIAVASFTIAVDRDRKDQNGEKKTDFIDVVVWRNTAEFVSKYFTKGKLAIVSGRLEIREWTDKDGNKRRTPEVQAESVYFGESKKEDGEIATEAALPRNDMSSAEPTNFSLLNDDDSELPF